MKKLFSQNKILKLDVLAAVLLLAALFLKGTAPLALPWTPYQTGAGYMAVRGDGACYAITEGKSRVVKLQNGRFVYELAGTGGAESFYQAEGLCVDERDGSFYIQSVDWDESGFLLASERILHYSADGKYLDTPREITYQPSDEVNKHRLFNVRCAEDGLRYLYVDETAIRWYQLSDGREKTLALFPCDHALTMLQNFAQDGDEAVVAVDKRGKLIRFPAGGSPEVIYESPEGSREVLYSALVDENHQVYFLDIYHFALKKVTGPAQSKTVADARGILDEELDPNHGQMTVATLRDGVFTVMADTCVASLDETGAVLSRADTFEPSFRVAGERAARLAAAAALVLSLLYLAARALAQVYQHRARFGASVRIEALLVLFAGILSIGIIAQMSSFFRAYFIENIGQNLHTLAMIGSQEIEEDWLSSIDGASDYMSGDYQKLARYMYRLTTEGHSYDSRYGADISILDEDGRCYAILYPDNSIGAYFPNDLASIEMIRQIYETREAMMDYNSIQAGGTFICARAPILNDEGEVIASICVSQDAYKVNAILKDLVMELTLNIVLILIVMVFLVNEIFAFSAERKRFLSGDPAAHSRIAGKKVPVQMFRICAFAVSFILNMTSSFLSVYTSSFWSASLGIPESLAGAVPLFANGILVALSALFCPRLQKRIGFRALTVLGGLCSLSGDFLAGMSVRYFSIVLALLLNGLGFGILINSVGIAVGTIEGEEKRQAALSQYNAGCVSGINCGMIAGSFLAGAIAYNQVFFVTTALWALQILLFVYLGRYIRKDRIVQGEKKEKKGKRASPTGFCYVLMVAMPYSIMLSFIYFYIPIYASNQGYSEKYVSLLMMLYAVCGILLGRGMTNMAWRLLKEKSVFAAIVQALAAWFLIAAFSDLRIVALGMLLLGLSFSYGASVVVPAYLGARGMAGIPEDNAMSLLTFSQNFGQSISSIVCGQIMAAGMLRGIGVFAGIVLALLLLYLVLARTGRRRKA